MTSRSTFLTLSLAFVAVAACSSDESGGDPTGPAGPPMSMNPDAGVVPMEIDFEPTTVIDGLNSSALAGDFAVIALADDGRPTVAYGFVPFGTSERVIKYGYLGDDDVWVTEEARRPGEQTSGGDLVGLGFTHVAGRPTMVYIGGDDDNEPSTPYPTDLIMSTRASVTGPVMWTDQTLADMSGDAPVQDCPVPQDYCNRGNVVGTYAAIATNGADYAVVYRDTHFGFGMEDIGRADVEVYASGLDFQRSVADPGRSGGAFSSIALTPDNRPVLAYNIEAAEIADNRIGVWVAVWRGMQDGWQLTKLSDSQTTARTSVAVAADGTIYVAFFDATSDDLVLVRSTDDGDTFTEYFADRTGKTGLHPALALDANDQPVVVYTYCGPTSDRDCPGNLRGSAKVMLTRRVGDVWTTQDVDDGQGRGGVGLFNSIAIAEDGTIYVVFQDTRESDLVVAVGRP